MSPWVHERTTGHQPHTRINAAFDCHGAIFVVFGDRKGTFHWYWGRRFQGISPSTASTFSSVIPRQSSFPSPRPLSGRLCTINHTTILCAWPEPQWCRGSLYFLACLIQPASWLTLICAHWIMGCPVRASRHFQSVHE